MSCTTPYYIFCCHYQWQKATMNDDSTSTAHAMHLMQFEEFPRASFPPYCTALLSGATSGTREAA